ncbi:MAG: J domain-containing protein [Pelovirga sp.]
MVRDYYRLLGIPPDADQARIRAVYRSLAKRCHPDANHGSAAAAELFRQINDAYRILSDPALRRRYDESLALQPPPEPPDGSASRDPGEKFSHFLHSLLDAIFAPDPPAAAASPGRPAATRPATTVKRPGFNFYYHLALEKNAPPYRRGKDGVYRKVPRSPSVL